MDKNLETLIDAHRTEIHAAPDHVVQQWHSAIDEAAALERGRQPEATQNWHPASFFWGVAVTSAMAIGIGFLFADKGETPIIDPPSVVAGIDTQPPPVAFTRGLQVHLRDSRAQLAGFDGESDSTILIAQIIEQNRMFEAAADLNNAPNLARVLRAFEPILLQLAATDIAPEDASALRAQLAFELDVMLTKLASESSKDSQTT